MDPIHRGALITVQLCRPLRGPVRAFILDQVISIELILHVRFQLSVVQYMYLVFFWHANSADLRRVLLS